MKLEYKKVKLDDYIRRGKGILNNLFVKVPANYVDDFAREIFYCNLNRVNLLARVVLVIFIFLLFITKNLNYSIMYFLMLLIMIVTLFFVHSFKKNKKIYKLAIIFIEFLLPLLLIIWGAILSLLDCHIIAYVITVFTVSIVLYLKPSRSVILYLLAHLVFIYGWSYVNMSGSILMGNYINGSIVIILGWFISRLFYQYYLDDYINRRIITKKAYYDPLTKLSNRWLFREMFDRELNRAQRDNKILAVIIIDLDEFKEINDTYGHCVGDIVLCEVARRLQKTLRKTDIISRIGGDEFYLLLPDVKKISDGDFITNKIIKAFRQPFEVEGNKIDIFISMGISFYPQDGCDTETLLKEADRAMYMAKRKNKDKSYK